MLNARKLLKIIYYYINWSTPILRKNALMNSIAICTIFLGNSQGKDR